jgi:hypothetical protein
MPFDQFTIVIVYLLNELQPIFVRVNDFDHPLQSADTSASIAPISPSAIRQRLPLLKFFLVLFSRCHYTNVTRATASKPYGAAAARSVTVPAV